MKNKTLEAIRDGLQTQLNEIEVTIESLRKDLSDAKSTKRQVNAALKALGTPAEGTNKPAPKKRQVKQAMDKLLTDNDGQLPKADIEGLIAEKLATEEGCSAMGLALRLRELLATEEYREVDGVVSFKATLSS